MLKCFELFRCGVAALALAALAALAVVPGAAVAAECTATTRDGRADKADLRIRNDTDTTMYVKFYRGSVSPGSLKKDTVAVAPGKEGHFAFGIQAGHVVKFDNDVEENTVEGYASFTLGTAQRNPTSCGFTIRNRVSGDGTTNTSWDSGSCDGKALQKACPTCTVTCGKSWNVSNQRWRTEFKVSKGGG